MKGVNYLRRRPSWSPPKPLTAEERANFGGLNKPDSYCDGGLSNPGTAFYMLSAKHGVLMTMPDRVNALLTAQRPNRFCYDCIAESLELSGKQKVWYAVSALAITGNFHRAMGVCSMCGKEKTVIQRA